MKKSFPGVPDSGTFFFFRVFVSLFGDKTPQPGKSVLGWAVHPFPGRPLMTEMTSAVLDYLTDVRDDGEKYRIVRDQLLVFIYGNCCYVNIRQEDAAEFLAFCMPKMRTALKKYEFFGIDVESYVFAGMKRLSWHFYAERNRKNRRTGAGDLLYCVDTGYRYDSYESLFDDEPVRDDETLVPLCRLALVCLNSPVWASRARLYFLMASPIMSEQRCRLLCSLFNLPLARFMICRALMFRLLGSRENGEVYVDRFRRRRNLSYCLNFEESVGNVAEARDPYLPSQEASVPRRGMKIRSLRQLVSVELLSRIFGESRGTVSSNVYYAKALIECCADTDSPKMETMPQYIRQILRRSVNVPEVREKLGKRPLFDLDIPGLFTAVSGDFRR